MKCCACGLEEFERIATNNHFGEGKAVVRCANCGLATVDPMPQDAELRDYYEKEYSAESLRSGNRAIVYLLIRFYANFFLAARVRERVRHINGVLCLSDGQRVLEIGAGNGALLQALRRLGVKVAGVEPSATESKRSSDSYGLVPVASSLDRLPAESSGPFDAVLCFHVLEHLNDPLSVILRVKDLLNTGGYFIGEVPYWPQEPGSFDEAIVKSAFDNLHLFHYTADSLKLLLLKAGFSDIRLERLELKGLIKRLYPDANVHYLYPGFYRPLATRFYSGLQGLELLLRYCLGLSIMGPQDPCSLRSEWKGPNDWIRFNCHA